jgi:hypothetical protein
VTSPGDVARPNVLMTTVGALGAGQEIWAATIGARRVGLTRLAALPANALPEAIAPDGDRLVYITGSRPPALWIAKVGNGRLTARRKLYTDTPQASAGNVAW